MSAVATIDTETLGKILAFEDYLAGQDSQVELPVKHHFAPGVYVRECFIPAGVAFTGRVHKRAHLAMITMGEVVFASTTDETMHAMAPYTFYTEPGTKRAGVAITDTVFATVHGIPDELAGDIEAVERYLVADTVEEAIQALRRQEETPCLTQL
jgi:hypothetical protein